VLRKNSPKSSAPVDKKERGLEANFITRVYCFAGVKGEQSVYGSL